MKFAVTGGLGFIGSNILRSLLQRGHQVISLDKEDYKNKDSISDIANKVEFYQCDITNKIEIKKILKEVDGIFHEAALTNVQDSFDKKDEYFFVNVKGTENIFEVGMNYGIKIVFASSASVYGNTKIIPIKENFKKNPINPYGQTKVENEKDAEKYSKKGLKAIGLRYFNVYGIGQTSSYAGVITKFVRQLKQKKPPIIFGEGFQKRDFIHVKDVANANILAMESDIENDFFNIGTGKSTSVLELARIMIKISGLDVKPKFEEAVAGDVKLSTADITHIKKMLKWEPKISLRKGLQEIMK